jgi:hypothetical protein
VKVHVGDGKLSPERVTTPIAVYRHRVPDYRRGICYLLIQHASYLFVSRQDQPEMEDGMVYLFRGIQNARVFQYPRFDVKSLAEAERVAWRAYVKMQSTLLSDSALSFVSMHERINRCETGGLNSSSFVNAEAAASAGFNFGDSGFGQMLWRIHHQCFSLEQGIAERKFGPNFVMLKTPLANIRITTFFAGEAEAKVVDPTQVGFVKAMGCEYAPTTVPMAATAALSM